VRPSLASRLKSGLTFSLLAGLVLGLAEEAQAQSLFDWGYNYYAPRQYYSRRKPRMRTAPVQRSEPEKTVVKTAPSLFAVVSIADQRVVFYGSDGVVGQSPISTGMRGHPTPTGVFSIVQKKRWHRSNLYSDAPMPFMQRITWSGIALHAGVLPGYPASHGCIRMPSGFAQRIFGATKIGHRVIIAPTSVAPAAIAHKNLPAPALIPAADEPIGAGLPAAEGATAAVAGETQPEGGKVEAVSLMAATLDAKGLNPEEYAVQMKRAASERANAAGRATKAAQLGAVAKAGEARLAARRLAVAENALESAEKKLDIAARRAEKAEGEEAVAKAAEAKSVAEAALAEARTALDAARSAHEASQQDLASARKTLDEAKAAGKEAVAALEEANRRMKPVSVFISKKTGTLYVRQDFEKVFEAPVTVSQPERPIGTHMYMGTKSTEDGSGLNWVAVTMPPEAHEAAKPAREKGSRASKEETAPAAAPAQSFPPETASGALDRIAIPEETAKRLAELTWVGASIIVSDHGISHETGDTTDFIILTHRRTASR
jgi:lipoprotein-anchoring transpeptidase ErfK/SrfK